MAAYLTLPGSSGNYLSTPDLNLLDADTAHGHQSVGDWTAGAGASALVVASSGAPSTMLFGDQAFKATTDGTGAVIASLTTPTLTAVEHTVAIDIYTSTAGREAFITLDGTDGTVTALTAGTLTRLEATTTVTAGTKTVTVTYRKTDDSDPDAAEVVWMARACLCTGSDGTFVPSLRVVGDLDIEAKLLAGTPSAGANEVVNRGWNNPDKSFRFTVNDATPTDNVVFYYFTGAAPTTEVAETWIDAATSDVSVYRVTHDVSSGDSILYVDGVSAGTKSGTSGALNAGDGDLAISVLDGVAGRNMGGNLYYVTMRDGISGPIVAKMDADDWVGI